MTDQPIDPAAIMAAHESSVYGEINTGHPYCDLCNQFFPCEPYRLAAALAAAREERDLAVAHDRKPYPTAWAYEQAVAALGRKTDQRAEALQVVARITADLAAAQEREQRVRALHKRVVVGGVDGTDYPICDEDEQGWPCTTAAALAGEGA